MKLLRSTTLTLAVALALPASLLHAQAFVAPEQLVGAGSAKIGLLDGDGASSYEVDSGTPFTTVLWDPSNPDELVGGGTGNSSATGGYLVRQTFTSASTAVTTTIAPTGSFATPLQLSWDSTGDSVVVVDSYGQVHRVDATTGATVHLTTGTQPWSSVTCGAMDPVTQDVYVGTSGGDVWRLASGGGPATLYASGLGTLERLLVDDGAAPRYVHYLTSNRFGRLALDGSGTSGTYFGALSQPQLNSLVSAAVDVHGDFVLLRSSGDGEIYTLDRTDTLPLAGVAPNLLGSFTFTGPSSNYARDVAVVGATELPFRLRIETIGTLGAAVRLDNVPQPLGSGWLLFSTATTLPLDSGPFFGLFPDSLTLWGLGRNPVPGGLLAFTPPAPTGFDVPPLGMLPFAGQTWDAVVVAFRPSGLYLGRTNVERTTWQ